MKKIVVFDSGWGGELVADFLSEELKTVEIIRVIDWHNAPYSEKKHQQVYQCIEEGIKPYINKVDAIVLGGYDCSVFYETLRHKFPQQTFVPMRLDAYRVLHSKNYPRQICALMNKLTSESEISKELYLKFPDSYITVPDCRDWDQLIDDGEINREIIFSCLAPYFRLHDKALSIQERSQLSELKQTRTMADVVLLMDTHLWDIKTDLEQIFGWNTRILDSRQKLLHDVCAALKLRGVDGKRSK